MDKKIKKLMLLNILFYVNNFIVIILTNNFGIKDIGAILFFSPFILILFTTSIVESSRGKMLGQLKKLSILDFLLRCTVLVINFLVISGIIHLTFYYLIVLGIIFMTVNVYLEWKIYKQIRFLKLQNKTIEEGLLTKKEIDDLCEDYANDQSILRYKSPDEKEEIRNIYHSTFFVGYSYVLILILIGEGIFAFDFFGEKNRIVILMIAFLLLGIYFYLTNKKLALFLKDSSHRMKINLRDNLTFIIGLSIIYILQGYIHIGTGTFNFLGIFFAVIFFIPTIKTNHLIRDEFHKINKKYLNK
ncbi:SoxR reducing system RseC family protein [Niallia sp. 03091]|uniref:SoxR reducing system RseC family protein n=1 Tax=Niallia sp. 03091 TaxID=3458059 RepID=UPI004044FEDC